MKRPRATLRDRLEFWGLASFLGLLRMLPLSASRSLGSALGRATALFGLRKRVALQNLSLAFPDWTPAQRAGAYRRMCGLMGLVLADFAKLKSWNADTCGKRMRVIGWENLQSVMDQGRGGFMLSGHYGNWELLCAVVGAAAPGQVAALGGRQRNVLVEQLISEHRAAHTARALTVAHGLLEMTRFVKQGGLIATLGDQDGGKRGVFADYLGTPASVRPGVFRLAARLDAPILTGWSVWKGSDWEGVLEPPILPSAYSGNEDAVVLAMIQEYNRRLERAVLKQPDHWFWVHRRWKSRPPN